MEYNTTRKIFGMALVVADSVLLYYSLFGEGCSQKYKKTGTPGKDVRYVENGFEY